MANQELLWGLGIRQVPGPSGTQGICSNGTKCPDTNFKAVPKGMVCDLGFRV